jgi:putative peptidoglycan lipid II flippase
MVKLIKNTVKLLYIRQSNIISAATIIMLMVFLSRILGLFRDRLLAARFTPEELGVYYAAFRIPNMIFELLVMGALATAFIPVFTFYLKKGTDQANNIANSVINIGVLILLITSLPLILFTKEISQVLAPGFSSHQINTMVIFTRIMLLGQVAPLLVGNFITGILQSHQNFITPALAPVAYNFGILISIIIFSPFIGLFAPVFGVVLGAIIFLTIQIYPVIQFGYRYKFSFDYKNKGVKDIGKLMLPRTLGLAVSQIDTTVDLILATLLGASAVTAFNLAQHLQQLPIGLFGASIAQASLPTLSSLHSENKLNEYKSILITSFHQILFLVVPFSALLIVLRIPIVRLVFGSSTLFDWNTTVITGKTLAYFSISLFAQSLVHLLARGFYAVQDTKTPVIIGGISVSINALLSVIFINYYHLDVWGLGLSASIASIINMVLLLLFLDKKIGYFSKYELIIPAVKIFLSGMITAISLYIPIKLLDQLVFDTTKTFSLLMLTTISTFFGFIVYIFSSWFLEVKELSLLGKFWIRMKKYKSKISFDTATEVVDTN